MNLVFLSRSFAKVNLDFWSLRKRFGGQRDPCIVLQTRKSGLLDVYVPDGEGEKKACPMLLTSDATSLLKIRWLATTCFSRNSPG